jgi:hypothetical protein
MVFTHLKLKIAKNQALCPKKAKTPPKGGVFDI